VIGDVLIVKGCYALLIFVLIFDMTMTLICLMLVLVAATTAVQSQTQADRNYTYLALGDSYTIGESVPPEDNFPSQAVAMLRKKGMKISDPVIIAKTGWTTDELQDAIRNADLAPSYDFVSLLIGVNNQYRGRNSDEYAKHFEQLLQQAISFAGGKKSNVIVLSIPDWGVTPFADGRDRQKIAAEIDLFNQLNRKIASQYGVHYINITPGTRQAATDTSLLAGDKLHPSGKDYARWAQKLADIVHAEVVH
jgi:lysophospholipase L1-like esterase